MKNIEIYLIALTYILLWVKVFEKKFNGKTTIYKADFIKYIDFKPINCDLCLSFWLGIILYICFNDILFLTLPLTALIKK